MSIGSVKRCLSVMVLSSCALAVANGNLTADAGAKASTKGDPSGDAGRQLFKAEELAAKESAKGEYAAAAKNLAAALAPLSGNLAKHRVKKTEALIKTYTDRAAWKEKAATSVPDAKSLLHSLLFAPGYPMDSAKVEDPRIAELLKHLRANDKKFAAFFDDRLLKVKATATDPAFEKAAIERFEEEAAASLRALGYQASPAAEGDTFAFELALAPTLGAEKQHRFLSGMDDVKSCAIEAKGKWTKGKKTVVPLLDLSARDISVTGGTCQTGPARKAGASAGAKLIELWLKNNPASK